jgi:lipopolysaccharide heptosyltransferase II
MSNKTKVLIIRFSSFGDVVQTLSVPSLLKKQFPNSEIHWLTKTDFEDLIDSHPAVNKVWTVKKERGLNGLLKLVLNLRLENFSMIYDAHNNFRSHLLVWGIRFFCGRNLRPQLLRRSIYRWKRFLLFRFRINRFEQPFSGQRDLIAPLIQWGISTLLPPPPQLFLKVSTQEKIRQRLSTVNFLDQKFICLAPSAAHEFKKWPKEYWQDLIKLWDKKFILLGGPSDNFIQEIADVATNRTLNLAGQLSLTESAAVIELCQMLISNDTGLLHVAEQLGKRCVALMGPAPFGYPSRYENTLILEKSLPCKPCSKHGQGPCTNKHFHECLRALKPDFVFNQAEQHIKSQK